MLLARDLMSSPVLTCRDRDTLAAAARRMWDADLGSLVVVDDRGALAGMITDRDICMASLTSARGLDELVVAGAMAAHVIWARPEQTVDEVEELMAKHQLHRIPILGVDRVPAGIITLHDLAREATSESSRLHHAKAKLAYTLAAVGWERPSQRAARCR